MPQGKAIIFSAPSGSGKTTIVNHLMKQTPVLGFSISATTRPKRDHEKHSIHYYFLTPEEFRIHISNDDFVEWEEVYPDRFYGTLKAEVERLWEEGKVIVFDVDVVGGCKLKDYFGEQALSVFVKVPSLSVLEERLRSRNTESETTLQMRLSKVEEEWKMEPHFDCTIVNGELDVALQDAQQRVTEFIES